MLFPIRRSLAGGFRLVGSGRSSRLHFLAADDASAIGHFREFCFGGVGVSPVHVAGSVVIADESAQTGDEGARGDENIADDVEG